MQAPVPDNEQDRIAALLECAVLDTPPESLFDELAALAAQLCDAPVALISLVDEDRQWFKSRIGFDACETARSVSFCAHAIVGGADVPLVVTDATLDERFSGNPFVTGASGIRFYAGVPLMTLDGYALGTLCVIDFRPRELSADQLGILQTLARQVATQLEFRRHMNRLNATQAQLRESNVELEASRTSLLQQAEALRASRTQLDLARAAAESASRAKNLFLANMSHEIRTPMMAVLGNAELLADPATPEAERAESLETIRRSGEHLLDLVSEILDMSQVESGELQIQRSSVSPAEVLADAVDIIEDAARRKGLALRVGCAGAIPKRIDTDPQRLRQVLVNILSNAVKFTERGGVDVEMVVEWPGGVGPGADRRPAQGVLRVDVRDTGVGIESEDIARLFTPFSQSDPSTTRRFGGAGLGLVISRRLAGLLGGEIEVHSTPGTGSVFTLRIPTGPVRLQDLESVPGRVRPAAKLGPSGSASSSLQGMRLLVVEDGPDNQRLLAHHLQRAGAAVEIAENGRVALDRTHTAEKTGRAFDLILMDMQMPELDGYDATRLLRESGLRVPILALTANAMAGDRDRCLDVGCDEYATKPIDGRTLVELCASLVGREVSGRAA